jgi:hypothetical protein
MPRLGIGGSWVEDPSMKIYANRMLESIEKLLFNKPSSDSLWDQWLFWRDIEGSGRTIGPSWTQSNRTPFRR